MSEDGEKTCPLCAEEMDLTDQQLKPCKCGYQMCVWCWHHIMEMAEKEDSEGRCPACRTPYDKARIVGTAANCGRVVAELNADKKQKAQRAKPKAPVEARKHLNGVRVIRRNLVYIIGLPGNLADEGILERKEYFSQYGKVLKVSISRPANTTSASQQAGSNSTFNVYITYAREEEAIRCIQAVNNFVLEGKPLRACFGTTKYCNSWLRNMTCSNPHCLYLHDVDIQEDSFTKDEIISAYSRVPQSPSNNLLQRGGHVLPPPVDDLYNNGAASGKHILKSASNNTTLQVKGATNSISGGKSPVLPAAASWGSCGSYCRPPDASTASSQVPAKPKIDMLNSPNCPSSWHDEAVTSSKIPEGELTVHASNKSRHVESIKARVSKVSAWDDDTATCIVPEEMHPEGSFRAVEILRSCGRDSRSPVDVVVDNTVNDTCRSAWDDEEVTIPHIPEGRRINHEDGNAMPSDTVNPNVARDNINLVNSMSSEAPEMGSSGSKLDEVANGLRIGAMTESLCSGLASVNVNDHQSLVSNGIHSNLGYSQQSYYPEHGIEYIAPALSSKASNADQHVSSDRNSDSQVHIVASNGTVIEDSRENGPSLFNTQSYSKKEAEDFGWSGEVSGIGKNRVVDMGESSIIKDVLSLDFDPWDDSLSSANNFSKLLGAIGRQDGSSRLLDPLKLQHSKQSRFSFAQQENQSEDTVGSLHIPQMNNFDGSDNVRNSCSAVSFDTIAGASRGKISAPPGFSTPSRAPPPGFSFRDRYGPPHESYSENQVLGRSPLRNQHQLPSHGNSFDVEFIDPAILAVGRGILPLGGNYSGISSGYGEFRKQQFITNHQDRRVPEQLGERFLHPNDAYISSRFDQNQRQFPFLQPRVSHIYDAPMSNEMRMAEILRNEGFGLFNSYSPYNSGDIYNRALGR